MNPERMINVVNGAERSHINALVGRAVLLPLPLLLLLLQLFDALLQHIGPEVSLKVRQLVGAGQTILCRLLEDVLLGGAGTLKVSV